jgi:hypothetical protein
MICASLNKPSYRNLYWSLNWAAIVVFPHRTHEECVATQRLGKHIPATHAHVATGHPLLSNGTVNTPP